MLDLSSPVSTRRPSRTDIGAASLFLLSMLMLACPAFAESPVRIAVLKFGTASWELQTVRRHGFDRAAGIRLEVIELAGKQATMVALQGGEVDMALNDWLWVSRQRAAGRDLRFIGYSSAAGALVVPATSPIHALRDLAGKRVGIAGGPLDKNWLLLRALSLHQGGPDLAESVEPVYGAPPLLNRQLEEGRLDAVINFWPHVARLRAKGMRVLIQAREVARELGLDAELPLIGYVFADRWARAQPELVDRFQTAIGKARRLLATSDAEWDALRPLMAAPDQATFEALRDGFRAGIPEPMTRERLSSAERLANLLGEIGGEHAVLSGGGLSPGTFWGIDDD